MQIQKSIQIIVKSILVRVFLTKTINSIKTNLYIYILNDKCFTSNNCLIILKMTLFKLSILQFCKL